MRTASSIAARPSAPLAHLSQPDGQVVQRSAALTAIGMLSQSSPQARPSGKPSHPPAVGRGHRLSPAHRHTAQDPKSLLGRCFIPRPRAVDVCPDQVAACQVRGPGIREAAGQNGGAESGAVRPRCPCRAASVTGSPRPTRVGPAGCPDQQAVHRADLGAPDALGRRLPVVVSPGCRGSSRDRLGGGVLERGVGGRRLESEARLELHS